MSRTLCAAIVLSLAIRVWFAGSPVSAAQEPKPNTAAGSAAGVADEKAIALAEQGRCKEALPGLKRATNGQGKAEARKKAGMLGVRCSLAVDSRDYTLDFLRSLSHQFAEDPEVLFILVHAYSDLSTRTAQDLGRTAPQSLAAHKLNAEALEMQGKWDEAEREYQEMIEKAPDAPSLHYLLGRLLLSKSAPNAESMKQAKEEFRKELQIDPGNAGAEYILGEMARQEGQYEEAVSLLSRAAALDPGLGDAFLGWGYCLVALKRYEAAIAPLQAAVHLQQGNPAAHYNLALAFSRSGHQEEAAKEFAIHRQLAQKAAPADEKAPQ